jgi:outer membrane protein assembly factor BamB
MRTYAYHLALLGSFLVTAFLTTAASNGQEWTRFRGPNGTGESEATTVPGYWTAADYNWQTKLPGAGHGSPALWGDKIFLMSADPATAKRYVLCIDANKGNILWTREFTSQMHHLHTRSSYASCTPAVDADRVYVAWSDPDHTLLMALDHAGNDVWTQDFGAWVSQHGFGSSPMLYDDLVILNVSQEITKRPGTPEPKNSFVVGIEKDTGKIRWRRERKVDTTSYSVPCVRKAGDGDELVCCSTAEGLFALDPKTGEQKWSNEVFSMRTVSSPLLIGGLVFGTTGSGGGGNYVVAVKPGANSEIAYEIKKEMPYVPTPVAHGDLLFLWSDKGIVTCVNAADGKQVWQKRVGGVGYSGSPVRVGDKIYCVDEAGTVVVIGAGDKFEEFGRMDLKEECRSTPAVANGCMYIRTLSHLYSIGGK